MQSILICSLLLIPPFATAQEFVTLHIDYSDGQPVVVNREYRDFGYIVSSATVRVAFSKWVHRNTQDESTATPISIAGATANTDGHIAATIGTASRRPLHHLILCLLFAVPAS